jgi:hypothetical protein
MSDIDKPKKGDAQNQEDEFEFSNVDGQEEQGDPQTSSIIEQRLVKKLTNIMIDEEEDFDAQLEVE